jgi:hypothetical protein
MEAQLACFRCDVVVFVQDLTLFHDWDIKAAKYFKVFSEEAGLDRSRNRQCLNSLKDI